MAAMLAMGAVSSVYAATTPAVVEVAATVNAMCRVTAANLDFGSYDPLGANQTVPADAQSLIAVTCTKAISGSLQLLPASGTPASAFLASGADRLSYALYRDTARSSVWAGYTTAGKKKVFDTTVFGRIFSGQDVPSGTYTDTVTVRLDF